MTKSERELKKTLSLMPMWIKEKARRYKKQKSIAEKVFGSLVKKLKIDS